MHEVRSWYVALSCVLCGCGLLPEDIFTSSAPDARPRPTVDAGPIELEALNPHNQVRAAALPAPVPALEPMYWDEPAAALARQWASECRWMHSQTPGFGENLFASTATTSTIGEAVEGWASEVVDYSYASNSCAASKVCGHYTQLVWRSSTGVGCAAQICDTGSPFPTASRWIIWVCEYVPPGNIIGFRPY